MQTAGSLSEGQLEDRWAEITSHLKSLLTLPAIPVIPVFPPRWKLHDNTGSLATD